jgi:hypothetical protein
VSHVRPKAGKRRRDKPNCRKGIHLFGPAQEVGGGITRRVCELCSAVSIDLTGAHPMGTPSLDDFTRRPATTRSS